MRFEKAKASVVVAATFAAIACSDAGRDYATAETKPMPAETDNTGRNVRDRDERTLTPVDQSNSAPDIELTQRIRKGITSDDAMSMQARNVKVITRDGVVTLRGPVKTEQEKASIETLARNAGATRIDNQLEIDRDAAPGEKE